MTRVAVRVTRTVKVAGLFKWEINKTVNDYYVGDVTDEELQALVLKWKLERVVKA